VAGGGSPHSGARPSLWLSIFNEQHVGHVVTRFAGGDDEREARAAAAVVLESRAHGQPRAGVADEVIAAVTRPALARSRNGVAWARQPRRAPLVMRARVADVVSFS
jgi:hypothetical protein